VTTDALNCQRAIAQQIVDQGGDYALALKGNQGTLHDDVSLFLDDPACEATTAEPIVEADHGRIETRTAMVSSEINWLQKDHQWPGLAAIGKVVRVREASDKTSIETAYYLLSTALSAERFNEVVRQHWGVENRLHWRLASSMNEDQDRTRLGHGPHNLAVLRHMAINAMQRDIPPKAPCAESFSEPAGPMHFSPAFWPYFEVRLPWVQAYELAGQGAGRDASRRDKPADLQRAETCGAPL